MPALACSFSALDFLCFQYLYQPDYHVLSASSNHHHQLLLASYGTFDYSGDMVHLGHLPQYNHEERVLLNEHWMRSKDDDHVDSCDNNIDDEGLFDDELCYHYNSNNNNNHSSNHHNTTKRKSNEAEFASIMIRAIPTTISSATTTTTAAVSSLPMIFVWSSIVHTLYIVIFHVWLNFLPHYAQQRWQLSLEHVGYLAALPHLIVSYFLIVLSSLF